MSPRKQDKRRASREPVSDPPSREPTRATARAAWADGERRHRAGRDLRHLTGKRDGPSIRVSAPDEVYARDEFVYWGFGDTSLERLARIAGFSHAESLIDVEVDGHPRIMGRLIA